MTTDLFDALGNAAQTAAASIMAFFGLVAWDHHGRIAKLEADSEHKLALLTETRDEVKFMRQHLIGKRPEEE